MSIHVRDRSDVESLKSLNSSAQSFKSGNGHVGFQHFNAAKDWHKYRVYEQIWVDRNKPIGNPNYGGEVFNGLNRLSSTYQEKAKAIDTYLKAVVRAESPRDHNDCTEPGWVYNYSTGRNEWGRVPNWNKWGDNLEVIIPKPYDPNAEAKWFGIGLGVVGTAIVVGLAHCLTFRK
jgi:hypothetical protein